MSEQGWCRPFGARVDHYYVDRGMALCGQWSLPPYLKLTSDPGQAPNQCQRCRRKLDQQRATATPADGGN